MNTPSKTWVRRYLFLRQLQLKPVNLLPPISPKNKPFAITVKPNQSVSDLALQYLGDFNEDSIREIQELNPSLTDPDHIEVGQTIWLPAR